MQSLKIRELEYTSTMKEGLGIVLECDKVNAIVTSGGSHFLFNEPKNHYGLRITNSVRSKMLRDNDIRTSGQAFLAVYNTVLSELCRKMQWYGVNYKIKNQSAREYKFAFDVWKGFNTTYKYNEPLHCCLLFYAANRYSGVEIDWDDPTNPPNKEVVKDEVTVALESISQALATYQKSRPWVARGPWTFPILFALNCHIKEYTNIPLIRCADNRAEDKPLGLARMAVARRTARWVKLQKNKQVVETMVCLEGREPVRKILHKFLTKHKKEVNRLRINHQEPEFIAPPRPSTAGLPEGARVYAFLAPYDSDEDDNNVHGS